MSGQADNELKELKTWVDVVLNGISDSIVVYDRDFRITFVNKASVERSLIPGASRENIVGRILWDIVPELKGTEVEGKYRKAMESREAISFDNRYRGKDYAIHLYPLPDGGLALIAPEVSDSQKLAEDISRKHSQLLLRSQELAQIGHWIWDVQTGKVNYSDTLIKIYGFDPAKAEFGLEEAVKATHPEDLKDVQDIVEALINGAPPRPIEYRVIRPDGEIRYCFGLADNSMKDEFGKVIEVTGIVQDVTDRKRAEELKANLHMRDEFLSIASHELKTPLTSLDMALQLIRKLVVKGTPGTDPQMQTLTYKAMESCHRLTELVNELLDLTRIRAGKMRLDVKRIDLKDVVENAIRDVRGEGGGTETPITIFAEQPVAGEWDANRLTQVVGNLLSNAIKFSDGKAVEVHLRNEPGGEALIIVRDYGCGIAPEMHEVIFERFQRVGSVGELAGLGLGLYIVRQIVAAHGGTIHVESNPGEGARFIVRLPRVATVQEVGF